MRTKVGTVKAVDLAEGHEISINGVWLPVKRVRHLKNKSVRVTLELPLLYDTDVRVREQFCSECGAKRG